MVNRKYGNVLLEHVPAPISGIAEQLPGRLLLLKRLHVMKMVNEAVDQVRREEQHHSAELKNTRYVWLKKSLLRNIG